MNWAAASPHAAAPAEVGSPATGPSVAGSSAAGAREAEWAPDGVGPEPEEASAPRRVSLAARSVAAVAREVCSVSRLLRARTDRSPEESFQIARRTPAPSRALPESGARRPQEGDSAGPTASRVPGPPPSVPA